MNLVKLADHTIDADLLPNSPLVLDVGSRGGRFRDEILKLRPSARVVEVDPDENLEAIHVAIVGSGNVTQSYVRYSTGEGNYLGSGYGIADASPIPVPCMTVAGLMRSHGIRYWDLVKLDCEGSEFDILEQWPGPIATQLSVEFHDFSDPGKRNADYFSWLFSQLKDYSVAQHPHYKLSDAESSRGHWDTLLVRR